MTHAPSNPTASRTAPKLTPGRPVLAPSPDDTGKHSNIHLVGIDLGTSRSSIVSMHGIRRTVESYVGWPKDPVSKKLLGGAEVVFGREALNNRLALDLYRPLEKGVIKFTADSQEATEQYKKNLEAAKLLIHHLVELVEPSRDEVLYGVVGVPAEATVKNKQAIIEAAKDALDSVMLVSEPFSVAYGLGRITDVLVIDIGAGTTDLCRMHGTVPGVDDQIMLELAGDAVDRRLYDLIRTKYPQAQLTINMCKEFKEKYGFVSESKERIEVVMPVNGKPTSHDITEELKEACTILIKPIMDSIHKLVATFDPEFQDRLRNNVILSGGGGLLMGLNKKIEEGLAALGGGHVTRVEDPLYAGAEGALQLAMDMPSEYWQQLR